MTTTEREIADDAQWQLIQKNTFTRWANKHLKTVNKQLADLEADFSDGLSLVSLIEVLSGKKIKHVNKRPNFRTQKLENVTMALDFLEEHEGIRIVNIDSTDIVDKKLKLILGLIWTLIHRYSIYTTMWEGEEPTPSEKAPTAKQRLLNWIQSKVPDLPINNLTTDWNDGRAIGALVDAVGPGLCPDWEDWDPKKNKANAKEAMDAAEKWLDVPQLIKPDEMTNPKVDDLSMMTYLSQFPNAKLKPGTPVRPRLNPFRVRAYGPGLEPTGNQVGAPARFTVENFSAGKGSLEVIVLNPKGAKENCEVVFNNDRNMAYSCVYLPTQEGAYRVIINFSGREIPKSPYTVQVEDAAGDPSNVTAAGPGIEKSGVIAGRKTYFEVYTQLAGKGTVDVAILDPHVHKDKVRPAISPVVGKEGTYLVEYTAIDAGLHSVNVFFSGQQIPGSPFGVNVSPASNAKACYAISRSIQSRGIRVKDNAVFHVHTKGAGDGEVAVQIFGPGGVEEKCQIKPVKDDEGVYECVYVPSEVGNYIISVTFADQQISKSPFRVEVGPNWNTGLEGGVVNQPAVFTVETNGEVGALGFSIEGPSQAKIDCKDNGDDSADVNYWPTQTGEYAVHVLCNDQDIPNSPYMANILPPQPFNAGKKMPKRGKLKQNDEAVIRQNYLFLKEEIEAEHIVHLLYSKDVISLDDKDEIVSQPSRSKRNDVLLDKLMHAGPGIAYCEFLKALDEEYSHVSQKLRKTNPPAALQQQEQSWFEELPDQFKQTLITDVMATRLSECFGSNWESVMLELGHTQVIIDREKQNCSNNVVRAITNLLIKWRQKQPKVATYEKLVECLESMKDGGNVNIDFNVLEKIIVAENTRLGYAM